MKDKNYYVYIWYIKDTWDVFYVGQGHGKRCTHKNFGRNNRFKYIVNKYCCDYLIITDNLTQQESLDIELAVGLYFKSLGMARASFKFGGEAIWISEETKNKLSISGKKRFENVEERKKASNRAKKQFESSESRQIISDRQKKRYENPDERKKASEKSKRQFSNPEIRKQVSQRSKRQFSNPEARNKAREKAKNRMTAVLQVETGMLFESQMEAARTTGIAQGSIGKACREGWRVGGYHWKFV